MKKAAVLCCLFLTACAHFPEPENMAYRVVDGKTFKIASWSKITRKGAPLHVYVEGDGFAWRNRYTPSSDPTPRHEVLLPLAAADSSANVVYLARPCQYVDSDACDIPFWTNSRFAPEVMSAMLEATRFFIRQSGAQQVALTGYSGGGVVTAWLAVNLPETVRWTTIAGVVDHAAWTAYHDDSPLDGSVSVVSMKKALSEIPQTHYVGARDREVPYVLIDNFIASYDDASKANIVVVPDASHAQGWTPAVVGIK